MKNFIKSILPKGIMVIPLALALSWNLVTYYGTRLFTSDMRHINAEIFLDSSIPFVPWTAIFYLSCYLFWAVNYVIGCNRDREEAFRFISADFLAKTVCLLCFVFFPTTNTRPDITGTGIWDNVMRSVYTADAADNLFPSIHCLTSWFSFIAVRKNKAVPKFYIIFSLLYALAVCVSTLTTKQHVIIDMVGGVLLAEASYFIVKVTRFSYMYEKVITFINSKLARVVISRDGRSDV